MKRERVFIKENEAVITIPMSVDVKFILRGLAKSREVSLSVLCREIFGELCRQKNLPFTGKSIKALAKLQDRDAEGFVNSYIKSFFNQNETPSNPPD